MVKIEIYDTLRDGSQDPDLDLTLADKLRIAKMDDQVGVPFIELGWPYSNHSDRRIYEFVKESGLNAKVTAFGSTGKINSKPEEDDNLRAIVKTNAPIATIFGKSWLLHVSKQLRATPKKNLETIFDSIRFLKRHHEQVFYDAEHFFDGFNDNAKYALQCIDTAIEAGADRIILCDTNGGAFQWDIREATKSVIEYLIKNGKNAKLGIHAHNDGGLGVANSLEFVELAKEPRYSPFIVQVQGTFAGFGERIGNADLFQILGNLDRMKVTTDIDSHRTALTDYYRDLCEIAGVRPNPNHPFVGTNAGRHKAGVHVDGVFKGASYDFYDLRRVGNEGSVVMSDQAGTANWAYLAGKFGYNVDKTDSRVKAMLDKFKAMKSMGYRIGALEAEHYLLVAKHLGGARGLFCINHHKVIDEDGISTCDLEGRVNGSVVNVTKKVKGGPVDVTYLAMQELLSGKYESIKDVELSDYRSKKIDDEENLGAAAKVRVRVEFKYTANGRTAYWENEGVNHDVIKASREVIEKGFRYHLLKHEKSLTKTS